MSEINASLPSTDTVTAYNESDQHMNSTQQLDLYESVLEIDRTFLTLSLIIAVPGVIGNVLSFVVLGRDSSLKKAARTLLRGLAVADTFFLLTYILYGIMWFVSESGYYTNAIIVPLASTAQTITVWMVLTISADRYIAVCKPFFAVRYSTTSRARIALVCVWVLGAVYNIPRYFENGIYSGSNRLYDIIYHSVIHLLFRFAIPFSALIYFNVRLLFAVRNSNKIHQHHDGNNRDRRNILMTIGIITVFLVCATPDVVLSFLMTFSFSNQSPSIYILLIISNLCLALNSSVNFILYYFLGQRFRATLWEMVCCKPKQQQEALLEFQNQARGALHNNNIP